MMQTECRKAFLSIIRATCLEEDFHVYCSMMPVRWIAHAIWNSEEGYPALVQEDRSSDWFLMANWSDQVH